MNIIELEYTKIPLSKDRIFKTFQCEGKSAGKLSVFVRLSYCNLSCNWCDAFYTWKSEYVNDKEKPDFVSLKEIWQEIKKYTSCKNIVFTGGEPLLFMSKLEPLINYLYNSLYEVEIETNGTITPSEYLIKRCFFNVSPKLSNNGADSKDKRIVKAALEVFSSENTKSIFKFVISKKDDWKEIEEDFIIPFKIPLHKIYIMPEGQTREELNQKRSEIVDLCLEKGVNYSDRLQVIIWNQKRGV